MAIRMMTSKENAGLPNVETVHDYPGHETGSLVHRYDCPNRDRNPYREIGGPLMKECAEKGCGFREPLFMMTTHVGLVLSIGERNGYDDSDFFARVWNPVEKKVETITYATTRGWTYPNSATVDATPEVIAEYEAYMKAAREAADKRAAERDAKVPLKGRVVKVVKGGRKVPVGVVGRVFWFGKDEYYRGARYAPSAFLDTLDWVELGAYRVGVEANGTKYFLNAKNVEVLDLAVAS